MILRADEGGWIAVPVRDFAGMEFDYQYDRRVAADGSVEVVWTLKPLTVEQAQALRREEFERWGPESECEGLERSISRTKSKDAVRAEKRAVRERASAGRGTHPAGTQMSAGEQTASGEHATPPKGPILRLVR